MCSEAKQEARNVGRPALAMPEPIPDTPEKVANAILSTPPKKRDEWKFVQARSQIWPLAADEDGSACNVLHGSPST